MDTTGYGGDVNIDRGRGRTRNRDTETTGHNEITNVGKMVLLLLLLISRN